LLWEWNLIWFWEELELSAQCEACFVIRCEDLKRLVLFVLDFIGQKEEGAIVGVRFNFLFLEMGSNLIFLLNCERFETPIPEDGRGVGLIYKIL
jgi:hypothetical protein